MMRRRVYACHMFIAFAVVSVVAASPLSMSTSSVLGQRVEVIKGKKSSSKPSTVKTVEAPELQSQTITDTSAAAQQQRAAELDQKAAALDAKEKELAAKEQAQSDQDKANAERLKQQKKQIERIGKENQKLWEDANSALSGN